MPLAVTLAPPIFYQVLVIVLYKLCWSTICKHHYEGIWSNTLCAISV